ncbi:MAG: hypothetical protein ACOYBK_09070, partial [Bilifractor sp.]
SSVALFHRRRAGIFCGRHGRIFRVRLAVIHSGLYPAAENDQRGQLGNAAVAGIVHDAVQFIFYI